MGRHKLLFIGYCFACGCTNTTLNKRGYTMWYYNHDVNHNALCSPCFLKYCYTINYEKKRSRRRLKFLGRGRTLKFILRYGICDECGISRQTNLHHLFYLPIMPWACTIELCTSCHMKESWRLGSLNKSI